MGKVRRRNLYLPGEEVPPSNYKATGPAWAVGCERLVREAQARNFNELEGDGLTIGSEAAGTRTYAILETAIQVYWPRVP